MSNIISQQALESFLRETLEDEKLSQQERQELKRIIELIPKEQKSFVRNKAFEIISQRIQLAPENSIRLINWLERVMKIIMQPQADVTSEAHFSPGEDCRKAIINFCHQAQKTLDICVFTISDDKLTKAIYDAHKRGVAVRIITDNDKSEDLGSDVDYLLAKGIPLKMDETPYHMHHKYALADQHKLLNGSFNWTRSATQKNEENILITNDQTLVKDYQSHFEALWLKLPLA